MIGSVVDHEDGFAKQGLTVSPRKRRGQVLERIVKELNDRLPIRKYGCN